MLSFCIYIYQLLGLIGIGRWPGPFANDRRGQFTNRPAIREPSHFAARPEHIRAFGLNPNIINNPGKFRSQVICYMHGFFPNAARRLSPIAILVLTQSMRRQIFSPGPRPAIDMISRLHASTNLGIYTDTPPISTLIPTYPTSLRI